MSNAPGSEIYGNGVQSPRHRDVALALAPPIGVCLNENAAVTDHPVAGEIPAGTYICRDNDFSCYTVADQNRLHAGLQDPETMKITAYPVQDVDQGGRHVAAYAWVIWTDSNRLYLNNGPFLDADKARFEQRLIVEPDSKP